MSKAKVHVLEDLLSGESITVDQLTFGLETIMGMIGVDSAVRFKQGNVLPNNKVVAIYQNSAYVWYGDYPKTIDVDTPDLEQGWKALDRVVNNTDTVRESLKRLAAEAGFNLVDGSFEEGATLESSTDVIWWKASGKYYQWNGAFPRVVAANAVPTDYGVIGSDWIDVTGTSSPRVTPDTFEDYTEVPYSKNFGITNTQEDQTSKLSMMFESKNGYEIERGVSVNQDGSDPHVTRGVRPYNGPYKFTYGGRKHQKETFGVFDDACTLSIWASNEDAEQNTQILGASTGAAIAAYGNVDTAAVYMANYAQPAKIQSTATTYTTNSVTVTGLDSSLLKPYQVIGAEDGSTLYVGLVKSWSGETIMVDGWYVLGTGVQGTPSAGSKIVLNPTTRVWAENCIVEIETGDYPTSAVGNETMLNLEKAGTGTRSQIFKAINNNLAGEVAAYAYQAIGLFSEAVKVNEGALTGIKVENAASYGFRSFQDGDAYTSTVAFVSDPKAGSSKGADVSFRANTPAIAFQVMDATSRALQVRKSGVERLYIDGSGSIYQTSGVGEGTLVAQFGAGASSGCVIRQAAGTGASASAAAMQIGKNSSTSRSINAAGTINASGADYAEYIKKSTSCGIINAGDIVGINKDGELTDKFSESIHFAIKSTAPNLVGGDNWFNEEEPDVRSSEWYEWKAEMDALVKPVAPIKPIAPKTSKQSIMDAYVIALKSYEDLLNTYNLNVSEYENSYTALVEKEPKEESAAYQDWKARMEEARLTVDRIAFCGVVPINKVSGNVGEYVVAIANADDSIGNVCKAAKDMTFMDYDASVGKLYSIYNGVSKVFVKSL